MHLFCSWALCTGWPDRIRAGFLFLLPSQCLYQTHRSLNIKASSDLTMDDAIAMQSKCSPGPRKQWGLNNTAPVYPDCQGSNNNLYIQGPDIRGIGDSPAARSGAFPAHLGSLLHLSSILLHHKSNLSPTPEELLGHHPLGLSAWLLSAA